MLLCVYGWIYDHILLLVSSPTILVSPSYICLKTKRALQFEPAVICCSLLPVLLVCMCMHA